MKANPETAARRVAKALDARLSIRRTYGATGDDWCGFAYDVGRHLSDLSDPVFVRYLVLGIVDREEERERIPELIRLVTVDGKPVQS